MKISKIQTYSMQNKTFCNSRKHDLPSQSSIQPSFRGLNGGITGLCSATLFGMAGLILASIKLFPIDGMVALGGIFTSAFVGAYLGDRAENKYDNFIKNKDKNN